MSFSDPVFHLVHGADGTPTSGVLLLGLRRESLSPIDLDPRRLDRPKSMSAKPIKRMMK